MRLAFALFVDIKTPLFPTSISPSRQLGLRGGYGYVPVLDERCEVGASFLLTWPAILRMCVLLF